MSGRQIARGVGWNLLGQAASIAAALFCLPVITHSLGPEGFGLLALAWTFVGYFSIFDLGLGKAMTRSVAHRIAAGEEHAVPATVWTALAAIAVLGTLALTVAWFAAPAVVHTLRTSRPLQAQALQTVHLLALSIPVVMVGAALRGVLIAHLRFKLVNLLGIPLGIWSYVGPIAVLPFSHSVTLIVGLLLAGRVAEFLLYLVFCMRIMPALRSVAVRLHVVWPLLTFGGWLTLDNTIDPLINFLDRFLLGALVSLSAVAFYQVPYQLAAQTWILASASAGVLFPAFTRTLARDPARSRFLFRRAAKYLFLVMFPITLCVVAFAQPGLQLWLGAAYAARSTAVLQLVAVGVLITSVGTVGASFNASSGRPDVNAKLGLLKLALHLAPLWWVLPTFGVAGLAGLWMACASTEAVGMLLFASFKLHVSRWRVLIRAAQSIAIWVVLGGAALPLPLEVKAGYVLAVLGGAAYIAWRHLLSGGERRMFRARLRLRAV